MSFVSHARPHFAAEESSLRSLRKAARADIALPDDAHATRALAAPNPVARDLARAAVVRTGAAAGEQPAASGADPLDEVPPEIRERARAAAMRVAAGFFSTPAADFRAELRSIAEFGPHAGGVVRAALYLALCDPNSNCVTFHESYFNFMAALLRRAKCPAENEPEQRLFTAIHTELIERRVAAGPGVLRAVLAASSRYRQDATERERMFSWIGLSAVRICAKLLWNTLDAPPEQRALAVELADELCAALDLEADLAAYMEPATAQHRRGHVAVPQQDPPLTAEQQFALPHAVQAESQVDVERKQGQFARDSLAFTLLHGFAAGIPHSVRPFLLELQASPRLALDRIEAEVAAAAPGLMLADPAHSGALMRLVESVLGSQTQDVRLAFIRRLGRSELLWQRPELLHACRRGIDNVESNQRGRNGTLDERAADELRCALDAPNATRTPRHSESDSRERKEPSRSPGSPRLSAFDLRAGSESPLSRRSPRHSPRQSPRHSGAASPARQSGASGGAPVG